MRVVLVVVLVVGECGCVVVLGRWLLLDQGAG